MINMHHKVTNQPTIKPASFTIWSQVYNIKIFTFKHGLNIGQDTYSVLTICLQANEYTEIHVITIANTHTLKTNV